MHFIFITSFIICCCILPINGLETKIFTSKAQADSNLYKVTKLDSINGFYVIYVERDSLIYKVVSQKQKLANCHLIQPDSSYTFNLKSYFGDYSYIALNRNYIRMNDTKIKLEGDSIIWDIYLTNNLKGLCYCNKDTINQ